MDGTNSRTPIATAPWHAQCDALIRLALDEDVGTGDVTSRATIDPDDTCEARVVAKAPLVVAGLRWFARVFELVDPAVVVERRVADGTAVEPGTDVAWLSGPTRSVLMGERAALNILQRLSGTATLTRAPPSSSR